MNRRSFLQASAASIATLTAARPSAAADPRVLRFVPHTNLTILDPMVTFTAVTVMHGYAVFDTLYGVDADMQPRPQMAEGAETSADGLVWTIKLREGLRFHNGEPVRAQDCAASLNRWSQRDTYGQALRAAVVAFEAADDRTIRIRLKRPFARLLEVIGKPHSTPAFIMPEHLALTDPNKPVTEMIGSGPFRFKADEYVSGSRMVYTRNAQYQPRSEAASMTSGGKQVHLDRVEWTVMPDPATAAAALQSGEVDWLDLALPDLVPLLRRNAAITTQRADPYGLIAFMRFNHLQPPFNNPELRRIVLAHVQQEDYMRAIMGDDTATWSECLAMLPCGLPQVTAPWKDAMPQSADMAAGRAAVIKAGYKGEPVVLLNPTDLSTIAPHGPLTADLLTRLGFKVDVQDMDWGTLQAKKLSKAPVAEGGWSLYHTNWPSVSIANPAMNANIRGQGDLGMTGWYGSGEMESLTAQWLDAKEPAESQRLMDAVQKLAFHDVPSIQLGQFYNLTAYRKNVSGILPGAAAYFWNVKKSA